jgi:hypothetical protein
MVSRDGRIAPLEGRDVNDQRINESWGCGGCLGSVLCWTGLFLLICPALSGCASAEYLPEFVDNAFDGYYLLFGFLGLAMIFIGGWLDDL